VEIVYNMVDTVLPLARVVKLMFRSCIVAAVNGETVLRIGELSKRSGVSPELLRAWERRYGLLSPTRSSGGLRLYSLDDLERVRLMRRHLDGGLAAAEAATLVSRAPVGERVGESAVVSPPEAQSELAAALDAFDEASAQAVIDRLLATTTLDAFLGEVVLPYLRELGERWERGEASVAQEHFASSILRGRLLGLARGWGLGLGPLALLACLPDEQHELGLVAFGLALRARGWRIGYLGSDAPLDTVGRAADALRPELVVLSTVSEDQVRAVGFELRALAEGHRVAVGGAGAAGGAAGDLGAIALAGDVVAEAGRVTALVQSARS
jgi:MerR family transcriptional regulator, light-induced transcriptional regulator